MYLHPGSQVTCVARLVGRTLPVSSTRSGHYTTRVPDFSCLGTLKERVSPHRGLWRYDGQPFRNLVREGLPTIHLEAGPDAGPDS